MLAVAHPAKLREEFPSKRSNSFPKSERKPNFLKREISFRRQKNLTDAQKNEKAMKRKQEIEEAQFSESDKSAGNRTPTPEHKASPRTPDLRRRTAKVRRSKSLPASFRSKNLAQITQSPLILGDYNDYFEDFQYVPNSPGLARPKKQKTSLMEKVNQIRSKTSFSYKEMTSFRRNQEFNSAALKRLTSTILKKTMKNMSYDHTRANRRSRSITQEIESTVRHRLNGGEETGDKYKIVAVVFMGELKEHGLSFATQCTYEPSNDYFATATTQTEDTLVCAIVTVSKLM